jgi:hypothetical protein
MGKRANRSPNAIENRLVVCVRPSFVRALFRARNAVNLCRVYA